MTKFQMSALQWAQRYLAGQSSSRLLGWSEGEFADETYGVLQTPHYSGLEPGVP
jgi:hypothetical protein